MASTKSAANFRNPANTGKHSALPPKSPFPTMPASYIDNGFGHSSIPRGVPRARDGQRHHQRTSSESFLEEQPSWLDELLDEPEMPVKRGAHRRSSSDSFAYMDVANMYSNTNNLALEEQRHRGNKLLPSWGSQDFHSFQDVPHPLYYTEANSFAMPRNRGWESASEMVAYPNNLPVTKDDAINHGLSNAMMELHATSPTVNGKQDQEEHIQDSSERKDGSHPKQSQTEMDPKRVKQQFAQRSRVRKLQYISELERNVQALQAEGLEVSAELEFLDRQNLILNLENKTLKQRLDNLAQEQLIKHLQQEMLECEIARLRALYQQQQQQQQQPPRQPTPTHSRSSSRDLDLQFANLSLKHREVNSE